MFNRRRHRRGPYSLAQAPSRGRSMLPSILLLVVVIFALFYLGSVLVGWFGGSALSERAAVLVTVDEGAASVSLEGAEPQRAEDGLPLYSGDSVSTNASGRATLSFFDGSLIRLDHATGLTILESTRASSDSEFSVELTLGRAWLHAVDPSIFSGSVARTFSTPAFTLTIPPGTRALVGVRSIAVFESDDLGVTLTPTEGDSSIFVGEGQMFELPIDADLSGDLYDHRSALADAVREDDFVELSMGMQPDPDDGGEDGSSSAAGDENAILTVIAPQEGATVRGATVKIDGTINREVVRVRVNGYQASVDTERGTFSQELAVEGGADMQIHIEALNDKGIVLDEAQRTVKVDAAPAPAPTITGPAKTGETYRTQAREIVIQGNAPADAAAIYVNDYKLQLFKPGNDTWSYLAKTELGNLVDGRNVYSVVAENAAGERSAPAVLTILVEAGSEGVLSSTSSSAGTVASSSSSVSSVREEDLPKNAPLTPGVLAVTAPTAGTTHTATGGELLIEGTTSAQTDSVWVNGYRLQLYKPGRTYWNYIAQESFGNLKRGANTYRIVVRNAKGEILDVLEYVITW